MVGVSDFARDLPGAEGKARLGGFAPDLERVVQLAPDLVVVSRDGTDRAAWEKLTSMGLNVVVTGGSTLDGVLDDIARVGAAIGEPEKAAALDPSRRECCYRMLAPLHEKIGRMDEAVRYYKKAIMDSRGRTAEKAT